MSIRHKTAPAGLLCLTVILAVLFLFTGCRSAETGDNPAGTFEKISPAEAEQLIRENQDNPEFQIIDVRTAEEFIAGHLAGAVNIDYYQTDFKTRLDKLDKDKIYLVYCRTARRSGEALKIMQELGFRQVYDMSGGIVQWTDEGYTTVQ
jgi:rhodanese-related sulfurtransferase